MFYFLTPYCMPALSDPFEHFDRVLAQAQQEFDKAYPPKPHPEEAHSAAVLLPQQRNSTEGDDWRQLMGQTPPPGSEEFAEPAPYSAPPYARSDLYPADHNPPEDSDTTVADAPYFPVSPLHPEPEYRHPRIWPWGVMAAVGGSAVVGAGIAVAWELLNR